MSFCSNIFDIIVNWWWITAIIYLWGCGALDRHVDAMQTVLEIISSVTGNESEVTCAAMITSIIAFGSFSTIRNAVKIAVLYMMLLHVLSFKSTLITCIGNWTVCVQNFRESMVDVQLQVYDVMVSVTTLTDREIITLAIFSGVCIVLATWCCYHTTEDQQPKRYYTCVKCLTRTR